MEKKYINPDTLMKPRGFTQIVTIAGASKLVFISGQVAVDKEGKLVGPGDLKAQIRQAAAAARGALIAEAALMLRAKPEELRVAGGLIKAPDGETLSYGALIGGKRFSITLDPKKPVPTKDPKDFALVGKPVPRLDIPDKVTGRFIYMQDFRLPDADDPAVQRRLPRAAVMNGITRHPMSVPTLVISASARIT